MKEVNHFVDLKMNHELQRDFLYIASRNQPACEQGKCVALLKPDGRRRPAHEIEREVIEAAVAALGSRTEVARQLEIGRSTLYRKLDDYAAVRGPDPE
jgi:DNA-binding NtrC family response regulator